MQQVTQTHSCRMESSQRDGEYQDTLCHPEAQEGRVRKDRAIKRGNNEQIGKRTGERAKQMVALERSK